MNAKENLFIIIELIISIEILIVIFKEKKKI